MSPLYKCTLCIQFLQLSGKKTKSNNHITQNLLLSNWAAHFNVVLDLWLSATGAKCEHTPVVQQNCYQLTIGISWQHLQEIFKLFKPCKLLFHVITSVLN